MAKCNLTQEEQRTALLLPEWGMRDADEYDQLRALFPQYMFLYKDGEGVDWWASCCQGRAFEPGKKGLVYKLKHNDVSYCPACGCKVRVKNLGRIKSGAKLHETLPVSFVNVTESGTVLIESGVGMWDFDGEHDMLETFYPKKRYYIAPGKVQQWKRPIYTEMWGGYRSGEWETTKNICDPFAGNRLYGFDGYGSFIGLEKLASSALRYCAIGEYFENYHNVDVFDPRTPVRLVPQYLAEYAMRPAIEMLSKLGLHEFIGQLIRTGYTNGNTVNWKAKSPHGFCKLTKAEFNELHDFLTPMGLRVYQKLKRTGTIKRPADAIPIISFKREADIDKLLSICGKVGADVVKAGKYIEKHCADRLIWLDYMEMAMKLDYDLSDESVLFPKNIAERHDAAAAAVKYNADKIATEKYKKLREQLRKRYEFELGGYRIIVPENAADIIDEGNTLHHCVGGYAARHIEGKTTILFFRRSRKPHTSFVTIELDENGKVRQIHGYKNERYSNARPPAVTFDWFFKAWQKWYRSGSHRGADGKPIIEEEQTA